MGWIGQRRQPKRLHKGIFMNWLKSLWLKVKLPKGRISQSTILIPMKEQVVEVVVKEKRKRKVKEKSDESTNNK